MEHHISRVRFISKLLDKFWLDPLIGLIPVVGDILPIAISSYIIWIAISLGASSKTIILMIKNTLIDVVIGLIPFVGDMCDFFYKSHLANLKLLDEFLATQNTDSRLKRIA